MWARRGAQVVALSLRVVGCRVQGAGKMWGVGCWLRKGERERERARERGREGERGRAPASERKRERERVCVRERVEGCFMLWVPDTHIICIHTHTQTHAKPGD